MTAPPVAARPSKPRARLPWFVFAASGLLLLGICAGLVFVGGMAANLWGTSKPAEPTRVSPPLQSSLPYLDEFNDPASGWPVYSGDNGQSGYDSGGYKILVDAPNQQITAIPGKRFTNVVIEFDVTQLAGPEDAYFGALCRYQDDENYYYLIIGSDGYYSIGKILNGEIRPLSATDSSQAILTGQAQNSLRAECTSDILALYANGELLAQVEDSDFTSGDVGLMAGTLDTPGADIRFTDFSVIQP
jgi:hypothetical protein